MIQPKYKVLKPDIFFKCTHGVYLKNYSYCYCTTKEMAKLIADKLNELENLKRVLCQGRKKAIKSRKKELCI